MSRGVAGTRRPWLVELVGPAGAGKTTLAGALPAGDPGIQSGLTLWGLPRQQLLASALELLPTVIAAALAGRPLRGPELAQMIRLGALRRAVRQAVNGGGRVVVMEEGPVFGLTWLEVFCAHAGHAPPESWRRQALADWAEQLDAVIRLDADDVVLAGRIRRRAKPHQVKHLPDPDIAGFTQRFRTAYDRVVGEFASAGGVRVLHFRTNGSAAEDATQLRAAIEETLDGR